MKKPQKKIYGTILNALVSCTIENNTPTYESYSGFIDIVWEEVSKQKDKAAYIDIINVYMIFLGELIGFLSKEYPEEKNKTWKLTDLMKREKIEELSSSIFQIIDSIPIEYLIYFPMNSFPDLGEETVQFNEDISINYFKDSETIPGGLNQNALITLSQHRLSLNTSYFCICEKGFMSEDAKNITFQNAISKLKQVIQVGFAKNFLIEGKRLGLISNLLGFENQTSKQVAIIFKKNDKNNVLHSIQPPINFSQHINKITINENHEYYQKIVETHGLPGYIKKIFHLPVKLVFETDDNPYATPIKTALEWAFEATLSKSETTSFIQTCIGLEAVLGDGADTNLTRTLSDRCAYLICRQIKDRTIIRKRFKKLYELRSKINTW